MSLVVLLQARLGSARLPGKVLLPLGGLPLVQWPIHRLATLGPVIACIPTTLANDPLAAAIEGPCIRGDEDDILARFLAALERYPADIVIRATADNPFVLPELARAAIGTLQAEAADYCSIEGSALGTTVEVLRAGTLRRIADLTTLADEHEHPTLGILRRPSVFRIARFQAPQPYFAPDLRLTIDTHADYTRAQALVAQLAAPVDSGWTAIQTAAKLLDNVHDEAGPVQQHLAEIQRLKERAWHPQ